MGQVAEKLVFAAASRQMPEMRAHRLERSVGQPAIVNLLTPHQQSRLREIATLVEFRQGNDAIFAEGDAATSVYLVAHGMARLSHTSASGRRQVIAFMLPGDFFGFPEQGGYVNSAKAMGEAALYRLPWTQLNDLMREEPLLQSSFLVRMAFDLRQAQKRILVLGQQNVSQRLASFLLELMEHADFYDPQRKHLSLPISRFDLADYLGTSPETVVRVLARLEKDGLVRRLSSRLLLVPSADGLLHLLSGRRRND
jgi:CRP-like cAMP-binding protein